MTGLELGSLANWAAVLLSLVAMIFAGLAWWRKSDRESSTELKAVADGLEQMIDAKTRRAHARIDEAHQNEADLRARVARIEQALADAPTGKAVHELALSITAFGGEVKAVTAQLSGLKEVVERQERVTTRLEDYVRTIQRGAP